MSTITHPILDAYREGELSPATAARSLLSDLAELDNELAPLERQKEQLRAALGQVLEKCEGRKVTLEGYGVALLAEPALLKKWNEQQLARLCAWLRETERDEIAEMIEGCREQTTRAGGLRVERERKGKG